MSKVDETIKKIIEILKKDNRGLAIQELSEKTKVSRITTSLALMKLEGAEKINTRVVGNCKLHYLNKGGKK